MYKKFFKRILDLAIAIIIMPFFILLSLIVGAIIFCDDQGPVFYNAPRLGKNGKTFIMYKFRTMKVNAPDIRNADGSTFNSEQDPRLTRTGLFLRKTSIDELPQLLNILKGDMSFVGPRPDLPEHINLYVGNETRKLEVLPGITGYSQAYFRNTVPWKERISNDIFYVDHMSLFLDVRITLKTVSTILLRRNVFISQ